MLNLYFCLSLLVTSVEDSAYTVRSVVLQLIPFMAFWAGEGKTQLKARRSDGQLI